MGFLKKVASAISAPVTVPLKVASNVIREGGEAFGVQNVTAPLSALAGAPYSAIQKGEGLTGVADSVRNSVQALAPLASTAAAAGAGIPALAGAGPGLSILTGALGQSPGQLAGGSVPDGIGPKQSAPMLAAAKRDFTMPLVLGVGAVALIFLLRR